MMKRLMTLAVWFLPLLAITVFTVRPAEAQTATWTTEFFDTPYLGLDPVHRVQTTEVAFNWGTDAPHASVPRNEFSARITTRINFPGGKYRFNILADDGMHLYVDFRSVLNTFEEPRPDELLSPEVTLEAGEHHIQIDYVEHIRQAFIYVQIVDVATGRTINGSPIPEDTTIDDICSGMWTAEYFTNANLQGNPAVTRQEECPIFYEWDAGAPDVNLTEGTFPADTFSVRWTSTQTFDGNPYNIRVSADDGVRVKVDGILMINEWHGASGQTYTRTAQFVRGPHTIVIEYFEFEGLAFIDFRMESLAPTPTPTLTPMPSPTFDYNAYRVPIVIINVPVLNFRDEPSLTESEIIGKLHEGEIYAVVGRNAAGTWWQIIVNGRVGWVSGSFVTTSNINNVPITSGQLPAQG